MIHETATRRRLCRPAGRDAEWLCLSVGAAFLLSRLRLDSSPGAAELEWEVCGTSGRLWEPPPDWGARGKRLLRRRGELVERAFAHLYETGGMRRTHFRGHTNILKRLLIHTGAINLGLILRQMVGVGKPRRLQGSGGATFSLLFTVAALVFGPFVARDGHSGRSRPAEFQLPRFMAAQVAA